MKTIKWLLILVLLFPMTGKSESAKKHHINWWFIVRTSMHVATASLDVAGTQHCIDAGTCVELNPLMPTGPKLAWSLNLSVVGVTSTYDYICTRSHKTYCWLPTYEGIGEHTAGAISGWTK